VKENVYGLKRAQSRVASTDFTVLEIDEEASTTSTIVKLQVNTPHRSVVFSLKQVSCDLELPLIVQTDKLQVIRDRLSNMLGCSSDLILFKFYALPVDPQKTPRDYEMQDNDALTAEILAKPPSQANSVKSM
jgi:hypothetical protein